MRSTLDIVIAVKESQPVTDEELRMCVIALSSFLYFTENHLEDLIEAVEARKDLIVKLQMQEAKRWRTTKFEAQKKPMLDYIGAHNMPGHPEYESRMKMFKNIAKAATGIDL